MISEKMKPFVQNNSAIRAMFEEGKKMASVYGKENVYDFSLGNPSVPAPASVKQAIFDILNEEDENMVHGYMSNAGFEDVREAIAQSLNRRFGTSFHQGNILMTVGAASGMNVILKTLLNPGDEVIAFAPYFMEYGSYVRNYDGVLVVVPPNTETFQPNLEKLEAMITPKTKAVIINTPNNPTGVVYSAETLTEIGRILGEKSAQIGHPIVLISDEPYRELAYDGVEVPFVTKFYANTVVCYSYSKSLSLPGERVGWVLVPQVSEGARRVMCAVAGAARALGFVCAPALFQRVVADCVDEPSDVAAYARNRDLLCDALREAGYTFVEPDGAFYLWVRALEPDAEAFCERARAYELLPVPSNSFGVEGWVRVGYCVAPEVIERSLPAWKRLAEDYGL